MGMTYLFKCDRCKKTIETESNGNPKDWKDIRAYVSYMWEKKKEVKIESSLFCPDCIPLVYKFNRYITNYLYMMSTLFFQQGEPDELFPEKYRKEEDENKNNT